MKKKIFIITPCSRTSNLKKIKKSINFDKITKWLIVYDLKRIKNRKRNFSNNKNILEMFCFDKNSISGNSQRNFALDYLNRKNDKNFFIYFLDDDNILHKNFDKIIDKIEKKKIYTFDQLRRAKTHLEGKFKYIKFFSEHRLSVDVFYFGAFINSQNIPWHYLPVWILISIPEIIIIFFIFGLFLTLKKIFEKKISEEFLFFLFQIFIPIFIPIILGSTLYDGWRQFYFIYPAIIIVSLYFLSTLNNKRFLIVSTLIVMNLTFVCFWSIKNHPYQYLYFNNFVNKPLKYFEKDFWGLSNKQLLEHVNTLEKNKIYYDFIGSNIKSSIKFQNEKDKDRYIYIEDTTDKFEEYYVFVNNRFIDSNKIKLLRSSKNFIKEIIVDNTYINGVYKVSINH